MFDNVLGIFIGFKMIDKINEQKKIENLFLFSDESEKKKKEENKIKDKLEISDSAKVYDAVNKFMNLGRNDRLDIKGLSKEERKEFLQMLAKLLQKGIVGFEILEVNGKKEKHFIENQIGNQRLYGAKRVKQTYYKGKD